MYLFEKFQWIFMIISILIGLGLGRINNVTDMSTHFITPFLIAMIFGIFPNAYEKFKT